MGAAGSKSSKGIATLLPRNSRQDQYQSDDGPQSTRSVQEALFQDRLPYHDFLEIYEVLEEIGNGGLARVYKIQKRATQIGGSSRPELVHRRFPSAMDLLGTSEREQRRSLSSPTLFTRDIHEVMQQAALYGGLAHVYRMQKKAEKSRKEVDPRKRATSANANMYYAVKVINLALIREDQIVQLKNEVEILRTLDHINIVKAYETFYPYKCKRLMIVMELCTGGDLYARMPYTEEEAAVIVRQLLVAITYMHSRNIIHRDIKLENILWESPRPNAAIKLIDFGLSKTYSTKNSILTERVGTLYSMSPETMRGDYTFKADVWSVGVCTYALLAGGDKPFQGKTPKEFVAKVLLGRFEFDGPAWSIISDTARSFCCSLLQVQPDDRPTAHEAVHHEWITESDQRQLQRTGGVSLADEEFKKRVRENIVRYANLSDFRKLALNVIAKKSSSSQISELRKVFDEFDTERNGVLSFEEFRAALSQAEFSDEEIETIFRKVNINRTNVINYTEFLAAALETQGSIEEYRLAEAFDLMDREDTGYISRKDLKQILGRNSDEEYIDKLMAEADVSKDGKISYKSFRKLFTQEREQQLLSIYDEAERRNSDASQTKAQEAVLKQFGITRAKSKSWRKLHF